jgi:hypothetical protein
MACVVRIYGSGLNCNGGGSLGNFGTRDYPEGTTLETVVTCGHPGLRLRINGVLQGQDDTYHPSNVTLTRVGCDDLAGDRCDCLNGGCVPASTYKTPGKYANFAACQSGCAKDSACTGECIPASEIAALQQAANKAQANCCK